MDEYAWTNAQVSRILLEKDAGPPMRINPQAYSDRREVPKYSPSEVALYLAIKERTLRNWFFGYTVAGHKYPPLVKPAEHNPYGPSLSFYNLAEAHVLSATTQDWARSTTNGTNARVGQPLHLGPRFGSPVHKRRKPLKLSTRAVRDALIYVEQKYPSPHPLISRHFYTDGRHLFIKVLEEQLGAHLVINLSKKGQLGFDSILEEYLKRIDRDQLGWPLKLYPLRRIDDDDRSVVIISGVASGRPTISGTGVRVEVVWNRAESGETVGEIAEDYGIEPRVIEKAISYFTNARAA